MTQLDDLIKRIDNTLRSGVNPTDYEIRMEIDELRLIHVFLLELKLAQTVKREEEQSKRREDEKRKKKESEEDKRRRSSFDDAFRQGGFSSAGGSAFESVFKNMYEEMLRQREQQRRGDEFNFDFGGQRWWYADDSGRPESERVDPFEDARRRAHEQAEKERKRSNPKQKSKRQWYEVLGVRPGATKPEIIKAYRSLALRFHPDRKGGEANHEKMVEINVAKQEALGGL